MSKKLKPTKDFKVYFDECHWIFDKEHRLKEVECRIDNKDKFLPVDWDDEGAYVLNGEEKIYVLVNCE